MKLKILLIIGLVFSTILLSGCQKKCNDLPNFFNYQDCHLNYKEDKINNIIICDNTCYNYNFSKKEIDVLNLCNCLNNGKDCYISEEYKKKYCNNK